MNKTNKEGLERIALLATGVGLFFILPNNDFGDMMFPLWWALFLLAVFWPNPWLYIVAPWRWWQGAMLLLGWESARMEHGSRSPWCDSENTRAFFSVASGTLIAFLLALLAVSLGPQITAIQGVVVPAAILLALTLSFAVGLFVAVSCSFAEPTDRRLGVFLEHTGRVLAWFSPLRWFGYGGEEKD